MRGLRGVGLSGLASPTMSAGCPGGGLMSTILSYNPIAYWPLNELSGVTAINYGSLGSAANGTHTGDTLAQIAAPGDGLAPYFDGGNDRVAIHTAALQGAFDPLLGSMMIFQRVTAGSPYDKAMQLAADSGNNRIALSQPNDITGDTVFQYIAGGTNKTLTYDLTQNAWTQTVITWDKANDRVKFYAQGSQYGATQTGLGVWVLTLSSVYTFIGSASATSDFFTGHLAHAAVWASVLADSEIANMYSVSGI